MALLVVGGLPLGASHNDSQATYPVTDANDKPSGNYVGSAGLYLAAIVANTKVEASLVGSPLCDLEVTDGGSPRPGDESAVDGGPGGSAPDGAWDDGGHGGVCHVAHYQHAPYNSPGCAYGKAWARDAVIGDRVWISAMCDSVTRIDPLTFPFAPALLGGAGCGLAAVVGNLDPVPCATDAALAIACSHQGHPVTWVTSRPCPPPAAPGGVACGPDGVPDDANFGYGDGSMAPFAGGVPYPAVYPGCTPLHGVASVFVWDSIQVGNGSPDRILRPTHGWIN